jgi:hypothetical protein
MRRHYSAYLLRHWRLGDDGTRRIEVVHIASGARVLVTSLGAATEWIDNHSREPSPAPPSEPAAPPGARADAWGAGADWDPW